MKRTAFGALGLCFALLLTACSGAQNGASSSAAANANGTAQTIVDTAEMFSDQDKEIGYDETEAAHIECTGDTAQCDSDAVTVSGGTVTITDEGTYLLSGTLTDGMIIVDAEKTDKLQLVLNGLSVTSSTSAALYIKQADKVFVTTASGTENTLANGGAYVAIDDNNIDAAVFSKEDVTFNGAGTLTVTAQAGHGIVSKDDLRITSGTYSVTAANHGLNGQDSVRIAGGDFTIQSGKDGIQAENEEDASLGFLYIAGGTFDITAQGDGLSASGYAQLDGGEYTILAGGGSANAAAQGNETYGPWGGSSTTEDSVSTKGIKASGDLLLTDGTYSIDAADDALHSNANLSISGGAFEIATGDDGLHADSNLSISAGVLHITESYEGLEGQSIDITGGEIDLVASDDGLNAAGGNDESGFGGMGGGRRGPDSFDSDSSAYIHISGGTLTIDASGDGIDSNGSLTVSGGQVYVSGPDNSGNRALDYASEASVTGGVVIAAGASQMAQSFGSGSTQGVLFVSFSTQQAGSTIRLTDASGNELLSWTAAKSFSSVVLSCPDIVQGESYTLTAGSYETTITMDSLVYSADSGMGGGMGGPGGMGGRR